MQQVKVEFRGGVVRADDIERLKVPAYPRIAFAGRSNVGKSSLLNALTGQKVARVSSAPGKTREMNFFTWSLTRASSDRCVLVDLPGYGFAKVAQELRKQWGKEITTWLKTDENLALVVTLADGRHGFLKNDVELVRFLQSENIPYLVAFTKMDKWKSANQRRQAERELSEVAAKLGVEEYVFTSAEARDGVLPLLVKLREKMTAPRGAADR